MIAIHPSGRIKTVSLKERWGVSFQYDEATGKQRLAIVNVESETASLSPSVSWHSTLYFDNLDESWKVLYHQNGHPVIVERSYGARFDPAVCGCLSFQQRGAALRASPLNC